MTQRKHILNCDLNIFIILFQNIYYVFLEFKIKSEAIFLGQIKSEITL